MTGSARSSTPDGIRAAAGRPAAVSGFPPCLELAAEVSAPAAFSRQEAHSAATAPDNGSAPREFRLPPAKGVLTAWHIRPLAERGWSDARIADFFGRPLGVVYRLRRDDGIPAGNPHCRKGRRRVG